jgi:hypothetical protein
MFLKALGAYTRLTATSASNFGLTAKSSEGGANLVRSMPATACLYSSVVGKRPRTVESTTSGVEPSSDSPFFSAESATTRP